MNSKGLAMAAAAALLITAVIGIVIIDQTAAQTWTTTTVLNESMGTVYNGTTDTFANDCAISCTQAYDTTNATVMNTSNYTCNAAVGNRAASTVTWAAANFVYNNTASEVSYTYSCSYMTGATERLIMEYFAVIAGVLVLALAGGWIYLKL